MNNDVIIAVSTSTFEPRDGLIEPGQRIEKTTGGWMHENCPADSPDDFLDSDPDVGDR